MSAFSSRSGAYKGGVFLLFLAVVVYIVGFVVPFWAGFSVSGGGATASAHEGIWMLCSQASAFGSSATSCGTFGFNLAGWFHAVRALEGAAVFLLVIGCIVTFATNCCKAVPAPRSRTLEVMALFGGVCGLVGVIVYGTMRLDNSIYPKGELLDDATDLALRLLYAIEWGLYLTGIGSGLAIIAAVIIGVGNKQISPPVTGVVVGMTSVQTSQTAAYGGAQTNYAYGYPGNAPVQAGYPAAQAGYPAQADNTPQAGYPSAQTGYGYPQKF